MTTDKQKQHQKNWIANRKKDGFKFLTVFVPSELAEILREQIRQFKFHNPHRYRNH